MRTEAPARASSGAILTSRTTADVVGTESAVAARSTADAAVNTAGRTTSVRHPGQQRYEGGLAASSTPRSWHCPPSPTCRTIWLTSSRTRTVLSDETFVTFRVAQSCAQLNVLHRPLRMATSLLRTCMIHTSDGTRAHLLEGTTVALGAGIFLPVSFMANAFESLAGPAAPNHRARHSDVRQRNKHSDPPPPLPVTTPAALSSSGWSRDCRGV